MNWQKLYNPFIRLLLKSPLHGMISASITLLRVTGRKSGRVYEVPVNAIQVGEDLLIVSRKARTWWRNLQGGAHITMLLRGEEMQGDAQVYEERIAVAEGLLAMLHENLTFRRAVNITLDADRQPVEEAAFAEIVDGAVLVKISNIESLNTE